MLSDIRMVDAKTAAHARLIRVCKVAPGYREHWPE